MRSGIVVCLAVLLVLAGCQGAPSSGQDRPTSPVGQEGSMDLSNLSTFEYPDGASETGLNRSLLWETHRQALLDSQRYTLTRYQTRENRSTRTRFHVDHDRKLFLGHSTGNRSETDRGIDVFGTEDTIYQRELGEQLSEGSTLVSYDRRDWTWSSDGLTGASTLALVLDTYEFEAAGVTRRHGTPVVRYRSTNTTGPDNRSGALQPNATATLAVDEQGIVRRAVLERPNTDSRVGFTVSNVSTASVGRPRWVERVPRASPVEPPAVNLSATARTVELTTENDTIETIAVTIHHDGGASINASALDVTVTRKRAYDLRELSSTNATLAPVRPFEQVGRTFEPGESVRVIHTVPPELYGGTVTIQNGTIAVGDRTGERTFPTLEETRSIEPGQVIRVLWNRSQPQPLLTYTVEGTPSNRTVSGAN